MLGLLGAIWLCLEDLSNFVGLDDYHDDDDDDNDDDDDEIIGYNEASLYNSLVLARPILESGSAKKP